MRHTHTRFFAFTIALSALVPAVATSQTRPAPRPRPAVAPQQGAAPGPMNAQSGPGDRMRGPGARGAGKARRAGGGHPAAMLLRARQQLELSDDQVKRLEAMQNAPLPKTNAADMMRAQADLLEATQGDGNLAGARSALDKLSRLRNEQMLTRIKLQQDVRAVLTPAQKTKVDNLRQGMRQQLRGRADRARGARQQGMRPKGPQGQPGMRPRGQQGQPGMRRGMPQPPVPPAN